MQSWLPGFSFPHFFCETNSYPFSTLPLYVVTRVFPLNTPRNHHVVHSHSHGIHQNPNTHGFVIKFPSNTWGGGEGQTIGLDHTLDHDCASTSTLQWVTLQSMVFRFGTYGSCSKYSTLLTPSVLERSKSRYDGAPSDGGRQ